MTDKLFVALLAAVVGAVLAANLVAKAPAPSVERLAPQHWQHLALQHVGGTGMQDAQLAQRIDQLGREGWQLVDVEMVTHNGGVQETFFYFKRPR